MREVSLEDEHLALRIVVQVPVEGDVDADGGDVVAAHRCVLTAGAAAPDRFPFGGLEEKPFGLVVGRRPARILLGIGTVGGGGPLARRAGPERRDAGPGQTRKRHRGGAKRQPRWAVDADWSQPTFTSPFISGWMRQRIGTVPFWVNFTVTL